jgi:cytochrome c-type biogenesis protein
VAAGPALALELTDQLSGWFAPLVAFAAGVVSFASPCVFPLVPGYLSFVSGGEAIAAGGQTAVRTKARLAPMLLFIGGFTLVFTLYGAFASTFVQIFKGRTGQVVAGVVIVALGLLLIAYALGRGPLSLYAERRPFLRKVRPGTTGAFPLGMAFAAGWTPCIGPVLGAIMGIAATRSPAGGAFLLVCYSAGLGVPFLLIGLGVQRLMGALGWVQRHYTPIAVVSGLILVTVGILVATGMWTRLLAPLLDLWPGL